MLLSQFVDVFPLCFKKIHLNILESFTNKISSYEYQREEDP